MARDLEFDGYWEGDAVYSCDQCGKTERFRFDGEDDAKNYKRYRAELRKLGWQAVKVNGALKDFCGYVCRDSYIRNNTI